MRRVPSVLASTAHLPEVTFAAGDVVIAEGTRTGGIWVLVSGSLAVTLRGEAISTVTRPGAMVGEISLLLGQDHGATVTATEPTTMRWARDGAALLDAEPGFARLVAADLAGRLDALTVYLADLKRQYQAVPGLAIVPEVLRHLSSQPADDRRPVATRDPDPEF